MIRLAVAAILVLLTVRAHRDAAGRAESALEGARARLALAMLVQAGALIPLAFGVPPSLRFLLLGMGALAGAIAWVAFARLLATGTRRRDVWVRGFWLGVAAITLASPAPWGVVGAFAAMGGLAFRWRHAVPTRRKYLLVIVAIALAVAGFFRLGSLAGTGPGHALSGIESELWAIANATRLALAILSSLAAFTLLLAIVRDPSLGMRTVGRRLALSHILVVLVPIALLLLLWAATTVLGVNRERALVAMRSLQAQGGELHAGVEHAFAAGDVTRLAAFAQACDGATPGAIAYVAEPLGVRCVAGDSLPGAAAAVRAWTDSLGSLPAHGLVALDARTWLGAATRSGARAAVIFVPVDSLIARIAGPIANGAVRLSGDRGNVIVSEGDSTSDDSTSAGSDTETDSTDIVAGADTAGAGRLHTSLSVGGNRYRLDNQDLSASQFLLEGHAFVPAIGWRSRAWERGLLLLSAGLDPHDVLRGMYRNSKDDPFGFVPLVLLVTLGVLMALVALWDILMVTNMARGVAQAIGALSGAARKLESGDLTHRIEVRGDDDLWEVARAVNQAAEGLDRAQAAEKDRARMESELALARRIQARLLPDAPPALPGLEIAGASEAAREVGGDYFDHIELGDGRVVLVIADVSGKGVPAALLMSAFRAALISHDLRREEPAALAERLNGFLHRSVESGKFVTAFIAYLDGASGELHYVNAGHNPSLLVRADGSHEWLSEGGTILGILPMSAFTSGRATLQQGDVLTLYTDGVTEGADASHEQWGEDRLVAALVRLRTWPCAEIARALVTEVRAFEGDTGPADDLTVIVARRTS